MSPPCCSPRSMKCRVRLVCFVAWAECRQIGHRTQYDEWHSAITEQEDPSDLCCEMALYRSSCERNFPLLLPTNSNIALCARGSESILSMAVPGSSVG